MALCIENTEKTHVVNLMLDFLSSLPPSLPILCTFKALFCGGIHELSPGGIGLLFALMWKSSHDTNNYTFQGTLLNQWKVKVKRARYITFC